MTKLEIIRSFGVKNRIIFFGNGPLAEYASAILKRKYQVIFHAHNYEDLELVCAFKSDFPEAHGVLASYGAIIPPEVLEMFEPEGILNIHPSLLPLYRGPSPIESAIVDGMYEFGVSVMKLAPEMDAGPVYWQKAFTGTEIGEATWAEVGEDGLPMDKLAIYKVLAEAGAEWICAHLDNLPKPTLQDDAKATYTEKMIKSMGTLHPETESADTVLRKIVAYAGYPKAKYAFYGKNCIVLEAHILEQGAKAVLPLPCADGRILAINRLQPEGKRPMDAKSFVNGYKR